MIATAPNLAGSALAHARRGFYVFPAEPRGKRPCGALAPHGLHDGTTDLDKIRAWWAAQPDANPAIDCGRSQLIVIDIDPRHGGTESLFELYEKCGGEFQTAAVETGGGGVHFYFTAPSGVVINSRTNLLSGIDVKATGGYVIAAGSVHESGHLYRWRGSSSPMPLPAALLQLLLQPTAPTPRNDGATVVEGQRNAHLASLAGTMRYRGMTPESITAALLEENARRCHPPLAEREVRSIASSIGRYAPNANASTSLLEFWTVRELAARVAARGPRRWLLRGIWPGGDYGVHAAEQKAQKTWNGTDAAVSVASGTKWLEYVPVDDPGPVLMFIGEGGEANILRRLRAIAEARGLILEDLPIVVCARAPHLNDPEHLTLVTAKIGAVNPHLVILDPLYLAARGANLADLYAMGGMLEAIQHICQDAGASLLVITHFNRKQGQGASRITGAGPAEWGRVLLSGTVKSRHTDPVTKATSVITQIEVIGGEIPDQTLRIHRRIWADNPDDLDSLLHVETHTTMVEAERAETEKADDLTPAAAKLLEALRAIEPATGTQLVDWIVARHGHGLKRETVSRTMNDLARRGLVESAGEQEPFKPATWRLALSRDPCDVTRDHHTANDRVTRVITPKITRSRSHGKRSHGGKADEITRWSDPIPPRYETGEVA